MQENRNDSELRLLVTGTRRDGRRCYDLQSKRALAMACLQPGVSLAGMALKHGVNANLLRKWVLNHQRASGATAAAGAMADPAGAFVPVVLTGSRATQIVKPMCQAPDAVITPPSRLRAQLPNGVTLEFDCTGRDAVLVSTVIETLGAAMFHLDADLKVYLHREAVDFRKSINGLATLVEQSMGRDPFARAVYAFRNRRCDRIKLLLYERTGFWLLMKRLEQDRFVWPRCAQGVLELTSEQLHWLLDGIDIEAVQRHPARQYRHVG